MALSLLCASLDYYAGIRLREQRTRQQQMKVNSVVINVRDFAFTEIDLIGNDLHPAVKAPIAV